MERPIVVIAEGILWPDKISVAQKEPEQLGSEMKQPVQLAFTRFLVNRPAENELNSSGHGSSTSTIRFNEWHEELLCSSNGRVLFFEESYEIGEGEPLNEGVLSDYVLINFTLVFVLGSCRGIWCTCHQFQCFGAVISRVFVCACLWREFLWLCLKEVGKPPRQSSVLKVIN